MANNCLHEELKASVDNSSLKKLGEIKIDFTEYSGKLFVEYWDSKTINSLRYTGVTFSVQSNYLANISGTGSVFIPRENLRTLYCHYENFTGNCVMDDSYKYANTMTVFKWITGNLKLSDIAHLTRMIVLTIKGNQSTEDIATLLPLKDTLTELSFASSKTTGSVVDVAKFTHANSWDLAYTGITGDLIDFAKTRRTLGETTGRTRFETTFSQVTFNNHSITGRYYLEWDATSITWNGETVNE